MALHAAELGFVHPSTGQTMAWTMPLPDDLQKFWTRLGGTVYASEPDETQPQTELTPRSPTRER